MGVGKDNASVYSSSSEEVGEDERGESSGESKGFVFLRVKIRLNSLIGRTPPGQSKTKLIKDTQQDAKTPYLDRPTTQNHQNWEEEL